MQEFMFLCTGNRRNSSEIVYSASAIVDQNEINRKTIGIPDKLQCHDHLKWNQKNNFINFLSLCHCAFVVNPS